MTDQLTMVPSSEGKKDCYISFDRKGLHVGGRYKSETQSTGFVSIRDIVCRLFASAKICKNTNSSPSFAKNKIKPRIHIQAFAQFDQPNLVSQNPQKPIERRRANPP